MRGKLSTLVAAVAILASLVAAPAAASVHRPIRGHMDASLNLGFVLQEGAAPEVSWYGTLQVRGTAYPVVYYGDLLEEYEGGWIYWEDRYEILDSLTLEEEGGVITAFETGDVIFEVVERGFGAPSGAFFAIGSVVEANLDADPHGLFDGVSIGDVALYRGRSLGEAGLEFTARICILR